MNATTVGALAHRGGHRGQAATSPVRARTGLQTVARVLADPHTAVPELIRGTLGRIPKRGDRYLRMLLTHGARSVLRAAKEASGAGREVCGVRRWALDVQSRSNHNKAACALANKMARICYATLRDKAPFIEGTVRLGKKISRQAFVMPA